jgi:hypothetical protein
VDLLIELDEIPVKPVDLAARNSSASGCTQLLLLGLVVMTVSSIGASDTGLRNLE